MTRNIEAIEKEIAQVTNDLQSVKGTETEVYARIVGYYRSVRNWNRGKRDEYDKRKMFVVEDGACDEDAKYESACTECENVATENFVAENFATENFASETLATESAVESAEDTSNAQDGTVCYFELFTRKTCPNCPPVKAFMSEINLNHTDFDVDTKEGFERACELGIMAAPTVVLFDGNKREIARCHNVDELESAFSAECVC